MPQASKIVSVAKEGKPEAEVIVLTEAVAIKETGPKETVAKFGEVYAFSPTFIAIRREVPTMLTFWNLQSDDEHDFMLAAPDSTVLMHLKLHAADEDLVRVHLSQGRNLQLLLRRASARNERANPGAATNELEVILRLDARFERRQRSCDRRCDVCRAPRSPRKSPD